MKTLLLVLLAALGGCARIPTTPENLGPYPLRFREIVAADVAATFKDPASVRDVAIGKPVAWSNYKEAGWGLCFQANGKNSYGGYTGRQRDYLVIRDGRVVTRFNDDEWCNQEVLSPWPSFPS